MTSNQALPRGLAAALLALADAAASQQSADDTTQLAQRSLAPVVVTATRNEQLTSETALTVHSVTREQVEADHPFNIGDTMRRVPGANVIQLSPQNAVTIGIRRPVGYGAYYQFLQDGVPLQSTAFFNHNALSRAGFGTVPGPIEVLKGPGTALYGSNAVAATINVITPRPSREPEHIVEAALGEHGHAKLRGEASGSAGDHGWRFGVSALTDDGYRDSSALERYEAVGRWDWRIDGDRSLSTRLLANDRQGQVNRALLPADYENNPGSSGHAFGDAPSNDKILLVSTRYDQRNDGGLRFSAIPYLRVNRNDILAVFSTPATDDVLAEDTVGLLASVAFAHSSAATTTLGLDIEASKLRQRRTERVSGTPRFDYDVRYLGLAPYLDHQQRLGERWLVSAGVRLGRDRYRYTTALPSGASGSAFRPADRDDEFDSVSPKLGATWQLDDRSSLFARYARGFRIPTAPSLYEKTPGNPNSRLEPEKTDSLEIGWRTAGDMLSLEVSLFRDRTRDAFVQSDIVDGLRTTVNAGKTAHDGVEVAVGAALGSEWRVDLAYAYGDNVYRRFVDGANDFSGKQIKGAPRHLVNLRLGYAPRVVPGLQLELELQGQSAYFADDANTERGGAYHVFNLRAAYQVGKPLQLWGRVINLADRKYPLTIENFGFGSRLRPAPPRLLYAGATYRF